jgi:hypothetical protein
MASAGSQITPGPAAPALLRLHGTPHAAHPWGGGVPGNRHLPDEHLYGGHDKTDLPPQQRRYIIPQTSIRLLVGPALRETRRQVLAQRMYVPGRVLHLVKVDVQPSDACTLAFRAVCTSRAKKVQAAQAQQLLMQQAEHPGVQAAATTGAPRAAAGLQVEHEALHEQHSHWSRYFWPDLLASVFCCCFRRNRIVYEPRWAQRRNFNRILVSTDMVREHLPDVVAAALQAAVADVCSGLSFGLDEVNGANGAAARRAVGARARAAQSAGGQQQWPRS